MEITLQERQRIKKLVETISNRSIDDQNYPDHFCFSMCFALSIYLEANGVMTFITGGKMKNLEGIDIDHFWLELIGYKNEVIIDPTYKQFNRIAKHSIYIGKRKNNKTTRKYKPFKFNFNQGILMFFNWSNPTNYPFLENEMIRKIDKNNLINASILYSEIRKLGDEHYENIKHSNLYQLYSNYIRKELNNRWKNDEELMESVRIIIGTEFRFENLMN